MADNLKDPGRSEDKEEFGIREKPGMKQGQVNFCWREKSLVSSLFKLLGPLGGVLHVHAEALRVLPDLDDGHDGLDEAERVHRDHDQDRNEEEDHLGRQVLEQRKNFVICI